MSVNPLYRTIGTGNALEVETVGTLQLTLYVMPSQDFKAYGVKFQENPTA